jgi:ABC-type multidrug transport system fused ATPase/permease subunit
VVVAHRLSTVRHADHIHVLEGGRIVESGSYADLIALKGRFFALAARQSA